MDYTFLFKISKDSISINESKRSIDKKGLNNTNVINTKELNFSPDYIRMNIELVASFLNVVIIKNNITKCVINTNKNLATLVSVINYWEKINELVIKPDVIVEHDVFLQLLDNRFLNYFECFSMPSYLVDRLDMNKNIKVKTRRQHTYTSRFMNDNLLASYSDIYYKKNILIYSDIDDNELRDIQNFLAINNNLKTIKLIKFTEDNVDILIEQLQKFSYKNINIVIEEKYNNINDIYNTIPSLKKEYKKYLLDNNIKFKVNYSFDYKRKNFFKEFNLKVLSAIILLIILMVGGIFGVSYYKESRDEGIIEDQMVEINRIVDEFSSVDPDPNIGPEQPTEPDATTQPAQSTSTYVGTYYTNYSRVFEELEKINDDTVGWIKINNTRMDYPVVQSYDNDYYLGRDFKKYKNTMGWIFMDYRNNATDLNRNTIIYGHNIRGGIMFGGITGMFSDSYLSNDSNNYITFNTKKANMKWKIFSMYRIEPTTDYLQVSFNDDQDFMNFVNMVRGRSYYSFDTEVKATDKILTLSTCYNNQSRNVIHAVLVEVNENITSVPQVNEPETQEPTTTVPTTTTALSE